MGAWPRATPLFLAPGLRSPAVPAYPNTVRIGPHRGAGFAGTLTPWPPLPHALTPARERGNPRLHSGFWVVAPLSRVGGVRVGEGTGVRVPAKPASPARVSA